MTVSMFSRRVSEKAARAYKLKLLNDRRPLLQFNYPCSKTGNPKQRRVRLIAANGKHLIGLEQLFNENPSAKPKYQFKRFLRWKALNVEVLEFNPTAL